MPNKFPKLRSITDSVLGENAGRDSFILMDISKYYLVPLQELGFKFKGFHTSIDKDAEMATYTFMLMSETEWDELTIRKFMGPLINDVKKTLRVVYDFQKRSLWIHFNQALY